MSSRNWSALLVALVSIAASQSRAKAAVKGWQGTIDLPTYVLGPEDPNPPFRLISHRNIYPYTMLDDLTDHREAKTYRALFLENEYLKAIILPDLGGRLYSLYDKVAKREVFYRNHVVKYGLVGLRGAWISGGIEFNFPDGHTVVTVSPVSSKLRAGRDSESVLVGGTDRITGMYWQVELTLRSGEARLEQKVTLFNCTPQPQLYWYWANAAVPATDDMQFIYPMREANPHSFTEIRTYPVWEGVDYSWYKNIRHATSLFARQVHRNFFGAYYHDSDFGVVHVADYREVPGKKIWSWGVAGDGLIWTDLLTDHDGPYNEIQSGRYETQLTQEFMPPRRVESWTEYWYPVQGLGGGFVEATRDLALNVRFVPGSGDAKSHVDLALAPTVDLPNATIRVSIDGKTLQRSDAVLRASATANISVPVDDLEAARKAVVVDAVGADGETLHWSAADPSDGNPDFVSAAGDHPRAEKPASKMTIEELFLRGVEEEKRGEVEDSAATYRQVLDRDPGYIPALLKLAWRDYGAADLTAAEDLVARALARNSADPQVHYVAGVIYRAAGRMTLAEDAFWASIHFGGPSARAYAELGEIAIEEKKYSAAAGLLRQALAYNPGDALVLTDLAVALRMGGDLRKADVATGQALDKMPLLPFALAEQWRIQEAGGPVSSASVLVQNEIDHWDESLAHQANTYLAVAAWYRSLGDFASADAVLSRATADVTAQSPMIFYYQEADRLQEGSPGRADEAASRARTVPLTGVFPQTLADARALDMVVARDPRDAHALYLSGTFLFAHDHYDAAAKLWLQARGDGFDDAVLERDLGVYEWRVKRDPRAAAAYYEKAIQLAPDHYRLYPELDEIYTELGDEFRRAKLFASAPAGVLDHDTVRVRQVLLRVEQRQLDDALAVLKNHRFKPWEGGDIARQMFVLANLAKGRQALKKRNFSEAEEDFRTALEYPENLGVGKPDKPRDEEALYWLGEALAGEGKTDAAHAAWQQAANETPEGPQDSVFRAMALERLGDKAHAQELLAACIKNASQEDANAYQFYAAGLAESLVGHNRLSQQDFHRALELDPLLWQARLELEEPTDHP